MRQCMFGTGMPPPPLPVTPRYYIGCKVKLLKVKKCQHLDCVCSLNSVLLCVCIMTIFNYMNACYVFQRTSASFSPQDGQCSGNELGLHTEWGCCICIGRFVENKAGHCPKREMDLWVRQADATWKNSLPLLWRSYVMLGKSLNPRIFAGGH